MAGFPRFGGMKDEEHIVGVRRDFREEAPLKTVPQGEGMEAEHLGEQPSGPFVALGDIHPHEPIFAREQGCQVVDLMLLDVRLVASPGGNLVHDHPCALFSVLSSLGTHLWWVPG